MASYLGLLLFAAVISDAQCGCEPDMKDLRTFTTDGYGGGLKGSVESLQQEINDRVEESGWESVNINLRDAQNPEFSIFLSNVVDASLKEYDYHPYEFSEVVFTLPVKVGTDNATNGDLQLAHFTYKKDTLNPYLVNYERVTVVDSLTVNKTDTSETWLLQKGNDELEIIVEWEDASEDSDRQKRSGDENYTLKTDFPSTLDWGCDKIQTDGGFCHELYLNSDEIQEAGSKISNINTATYDDDKDGKQYFMRISKITGDFTILLPFVDTENLPESTYAFRGRGTETVGVAYDCINEDP